MNEAGFRASRLHQNAVIRSLEIIGEAVGKVSAETQAAHDEIAWREMTGMRHRLTRLWRCEPGCGVGHRARPPSAADCGARSPRARRRRGTGMNADRRLPLFEQVAEAEGAVPGLRRFVLQPIPVAA
jgi:hypothetical protein